MEQLKDFWLLWLERTGSHVGKSWWEMRMERCRINSWSVRRIM